MPTITDITLQKKKSRANVFLDGEFVCGLNNITLVKNGLKIGKEITKEELLKIHNESERESAFEKALSLLSRQKYTKKAISDKLKSKEYEEDIIKQVIEKLTEYGYISDLDFANSFISANKNKSKRMLEVNLLKKGLGRETIKKALEENTTDEEEKEKCLKATEKYLKNKELDEKTLQKLKSHLVYKGFSFDNINYAIRKLNKGEYLDD